MQVPLVHKMLGSDSCIGIITADEDSLTEDHLEAVGIDSSIQLVITGVQDTESFSQVRDNPEAELNVEKFRSEVVDVASHLIKQKENIKAIVLECTDLPPFSEDIREMSGLPVFDIVTLTNWIYGTIS